MSLSEGDRRNWDGIVEGMPDLEQPEVDDSDQGIPLNLLPGVKKITEPADIYDGIQHTLDGGGMTPGQQDAWRAFAGRAIREPDLMETHISYIDTDEGRQALIGLPESGEDEQT